MNEADSPGSQFISLLPSIRVNVAYGQAIFCNVLSFLSLWKTSWRPAGNIDVFFTYLDIDFSLSVNLTNECLTVVC